MENYNTLAQPAQANGTTFDKEQKIHSMFNSAFPVSVPYARELTVSDQEFAVFISSIKPLNIYNASQDAPPETNATSSARSTSRLINGLYQDAQANRDITHEGKTFTANGDVAETSAGDALVEAFYELRDGVHDAEKLLNKAWAVDPDATVKIIFSARSIHLGKADKTAAYRALGWLYQYHPQTLFANLIWLARPVIEKKVSQGRTESDDADKEGPASSDLKVELVEAEDNDFEMVDENDESKAAKEDSSTTVAVLLAAADAPLAANTTRYDIKHGVAHGYWKDLANILLLAVNGELKANGKVVDVLKIDTRGGKQKVWDASKAGEQRRQKQQERHARFEGTFENEAFRALHFTIARLFASQLRSDMAALAAGKGGAISLAAKWCPSPLESHDKQTFIVSSIAEAMFPPEEVCPEPTADREMYLKHARIALRSKVLSPLRKHLAVVERDITAGTFASIRYNIIPSLAMSRYSGLFYQKDSGRFQDYLQRVTGGKSRISGAVLTPATLVAACDPSSSRLLHKNKVVHASQVKAGMPLRDGQWKALVQRIKDSGAIESAIAVCDVSGSMTYPRFADGTCPMDSAIGLSLLVAEVVAPPFGGHFITFSSDPCFHKVGGAGDKRTFDDKVAYVKRAKWVMSTDFVAVFEKLLLPVAIKHKIKPAEMVKKIFVLSDMQFNQARDRAEAWTSSHERIKSRYAEAGYETPELVFWNLAAQTKGAPVLASEDGVSLVSGYSQGMLKLFMEGGIFEDEVEQEVVDEDMGEKEEGAVEVRVTKKVKKDPLAVVKKAISHPAYTMLKVLD